MKSYTTLDGNAHHVVCSDEIAVSLYNDAVKDVRALSARARPDVHQANRYWTMRGQCIDGEMMRTKAEPVIYVWAKLKEALVLHSFSEK